MKAKIIVLILCFGLFQNVTGQVLNEQEIKTAQEIYDFHISKKRANVAAGVGTLLGGIGMMVGSIALISNNCLFDDDYACKNEPILFYVGIPVSLSSIYFFAMAGHHKNKAKIQLQHGAIGGRNGLKYTGMSIAFAF